MQSVQSHDVDWFYSVQGKRFGPHTLRDLQDRYSQGELNRDALVWHSTLGDWSKISQLSEFADPGSYSSGPPVLTSDIPPIQSPLHAIEAWRPSSNQIRLIGRILGAFSLLLIFWSLTLAIFVGGNLLIPGLLLLNLFTVTECSCAILDRVESSQSV